MILYVFTLLRWNTLWVWFQIIKTYIRYKNFIKLYFSTYLSFTWERERESERERMSWAESRPGGTRDHVMPGHMALGVVSYTNVAPGWVLTSFCACTGMSPEQGRPCGWCSQMLTLPPSCQTCQLMATWPRLACVQKHGGTALPGHRLPPLLNTRCHICPTFWDTAQ